MKQFVFLFIGLFCISGISAQYDPLLKPGAFWDFETSGDGNGGGSACSYNQRRYVVDQDTLINGHIYKKVTRYPLLGTPHPEFDVCIVSDFYYSANIFTVEDRYLREDVNNQIVYIWTKAYDPNTGQLSDYKEMILYAFDVEVGDVIPNMYHGQDMFGYDHYGYEMDETVNSVEINANNKKQIETDGSSYTEGIGAEYSLFKVGPVINLPQNLFCQGNNDTSGTCAEVLSTRDDRLSQIRIFPNPTSDKITFTNLENNSFKLYSVIGKEISFQFLESTQQLDISHLRAGIYLLKIQGANNAQRIMKIIKN